MRLVTYLSDDGPRVAIQHANQLIDVNRANPALPHSMKALLGGGSESLALAEQAASTGSPLDADSVRLLAPIPDPEKVICVGLNYADHAAESGLDIPTEPVIFNKFPTAVIADGDPIVLPRVSEKVDYEAELVVVIGRGGKDIAEADAMQHIAGYTCGHDVSARDWQIGRPGGQWLLGKTFDTFAPFGPQLVTADEIADPGNLDITLRLNGQVMQQSNTRQLIFSIPKLVSHISTVCTLRPGDVIFTGTPPGVGVARKPPVFLQAGDRVEVEIQSIGTLANPVVAAD